MVDFPSIIILTGPVSIHISCYVRTACILPDLGRIFSGYINTFHPHELYGYIIELRHVLTSLQKEKNSNRNGEDEGRVAELTLARSRLLRLFSRSE